MVMRFPFMPTIEQISTQFTKVPGNSYRVTLSPGPIPIPAHYPPTKIDAHFVVFVEHV